VLVLAVGKATKLLPLLPHARKQYVFELKLGARTDSGDSSGRLLQSEPPPPDFPNRLPGALQALRGRVLQTPPMHSALKVDGQPLYQRARAGTEIPRAPRAVQIYDLRTIGEAVRPESGAPATVRLFVECDAGTYVRVLCEDIGRELHVPAHMGMLVRVAAGEFLLRDARTPEQLSRDIDGALIDPLSVLRQRRADLDEEQARRFMHGNEVRIDITDVPDGELLVTHRGQLLGSGVALSREGATFVAPVRVLATAAHSA